MLFRRRPAVSPPTRLVREVTPLVRRGARALPPLPQPKKPRPIAPAAFCLITVGGWFAWLALLYRGRVEARAIGASTVPPERVREIFDDVDRWPLWQPEIPESGWLGRDHWQPGARFRWTLRGLRQTSIVEEHRAPAERAWRTQIWGYLDRATWRITAGPPGTRVEARSVLSGWGVWIAAPLLQLQVNHALRRWVDALVARAQSR